MAEDWSAQAACRGFPTSWWFPDHADDQWRAEVEAFAEREIIVGDPVMESARAKEICAQCPVARECMIVGVLRGEDTGIWAVGGQRRRYLRTQLNALSEREFLAVVDQELKLLRSGYQRDEVQPLERCERCARQGLSSWLHEGVRPEDVNGPNAKCGKAVTYARGCRCFFCRLAHSQRISGRRITVVTNRVAQPKQRTRNDRHDGRDGHGSGAGGHLSVGLRPGRPVPRGVPGPGGDHAGRGGPDGDPGRAGRERLDAQPELALVAG